MDRALTDATSRAPVTRGLLVQVPAVGLGDRPLRLDAGSWTIRAGRVDPTGALAHATAANPGFPLSLRMMFGVGSAVWRETLQLHARGIVVVRTVDTAQLEVSQDAAGLTAEQVMLVCVRGITEPVRYYQTEFKAVDDLTTQFAVPMGAVRCWIQGDTLAPSQMSWRDAAANKTIGYLTGFGLTGAVVPHDAVLVEVGPYAAAHGITAVWECVP